MTPRWVATADWCRDIAIPVLVLGWLAASAFVGIDYAGPAPIVEALTADAGFTDKPQPMALGAADVAPLATPATQAATIEATPAAREVEPVVTAVVTASPETIQPEPPPQQAAASIDSAKATQLEPPPQQTAAAMDSVKAVQPETPPQQMAALIDSVKATQPDAPPPQTAAATDSVKAVQPETPPVQMAALTDPSEMVQPETPPQQAAGTATSAPVAARPAVDSIEVLDECFAVDACVDRYLWALYRRTPKEDAVRNHEQRNVSVKKKGKLVTVTRTITTVVDEDFAWKDPKAAEHVSMPIMDYVIGGVDRDFKLRLFHMLQAAEEAGLSPGITSAFRDDYRQSIATGLKAANDRSYHGGSFHGGYGHGLAADVVSVNGATRAQRQASSETLWRWIDTHGMEFGIGRPYLDRDPPHVAPIDGKEYADHHHGAKARQAGSAAKSRNRVASADHRRAPKHT